MLVTLTKNHSNINFTSTLFFVQSVNHNNTMRLSKDQVILDFGWEDSVCSLIVPLGGPVVRAEVLEDLEEVLARLVVFPLQLGAPVKVDIVLPAISAKTEN